MAITLEKRQTISLEKTAGSTLRNVRLGLGWDAAKPSGFFGKLLGGEEIDLDASCIVADAARNPLDLVWFRQLKSKCGNILHTGDNRTGHGDGDDESIIVNLAGLSPDVNALVFTVNSFTGQSFTKVENAYCRIVDEDTNKELARINLSDQGNHTGLIMAYLKRDANGWTFTAVGSTTRGRTVQDLTSEAAGAIA
ncbi:MAG TPA: TerD family protein [Gammaproteobacteria bacterium]|nr:TerD family protein [Gammaproteobacteria bacterium]